MRLNTMMSLNTFFLVFTDCSIYCTYRPKIIFQVKLLMQPDPWTCSIIFLLFIRCMSLPAPSTLFSAMQCTISSHLSDSYIFPRQGRLGILLELNTKNVGPVCSWAVMRHIYLTVDTDFSIKRTASTFKVWINRKKRWYPQPQ